MGSTLLPGTTTTISETDSDRSGLMPSTAFVYQCPGYTIMLLVLATSARVSILLAPPLSLLMKLWIL